MIRKNAPGVTVYCRKCHCHVQTTVISSTAAGIRDKQVFCDDRIMFGMSVFITCVVSRYGAHFQRYCSYSVVCLPSGMVLTVLCVCPARGRYDTDSVVCLCVCQVRYHC